MHTAHPAPHDQFRRTGMRRWTESVQVAAGCCRCVLFALRQSTPARPKRPSIERWRRFLKCAARPEKEDLLFRPRPPRHHRRSNPAAWPENTLDLSPHRVDCLHHIFQNLIDDVLLKDAEVAISKQVLLE